MLGINEVENPKDENSWNKAYSIIFMWENEKGEKKITQAILPADLKEYLKDKTIAVIGALFICWHQVKCDSMKELNQYLND
jgi:hypothetical protein